MAVIVGVIVLVLVVTFGGVGIEVPVIPGDAKHGARMVVEYAAGVCLAPSGDIICVVVNDQKEIALTVVIKDGVKRKSEPAGLYVDVAVENLHGGAVQTDVLL